MLSKLTTTMVLVGFSAFGQQMPLPGMTVSARPGLVNYFEGDVFLDGNPLILNSAQPPAFLNAGDEIATQNGKAEILLMPGVFLRIGTNSHLLMVSASLDEPQLELTRGEAILEVVGLMKGSRIEMVVNSALLLIQKNGLYWVNRTDASAGAGVMDGVLEASLFGRRVKIKKGEGVELTGDLKVGDLLVPEDNDLYAWSSVRSQYEAAANYEAAQRMAAENDTSTTGWYFSSVLDCWTWLPTGAYYSPFGWGFVSPVTVGGVRVEKCPVYRGGHWGDGDGDGHKKWVGAGSLRPVPVRPGGTTVHEGPTHTHTWFSNGDREGRVSSYTQTREHVGTGTASGPATTTHETRTGPANGNLHGGSLTGPTHTGFGGSGSTHTNTSANEHHGNNGGGGGSNSNSGGGGHSSFGGGGSHQGGGGSPGPSPSGGGHSGGGGGGSPSPGGGGGGGHTGGGAGSSGSTSSSNPHKG